MFRKILSLILALAMLVVIAPPAQAATRKLCTGYDSCNLQGMPHHGYKENSNTMYWQMYGGHNCTNYAAYRMVRSGMANRRPWSGDGNAVSWGANAQAAGYRVDSTPAIGAIAWWGGNATPEISWAGHVAYVERFDASTVTVSEDNWGMEFHWKSYDRGAWPKFIHFNDVPQAPQIRNFDATAAPIISGSVRVDQVLTASTPGWNPGDARFDFSWLREGQTIPGATGSSYRIRPADAGQRISVSVTGIRNGYHNASRQSEKTQPVALGTMSLSGPVELSGTAMLGKTLSIKPLNWNVQPAAVTYQWKRSGKAIAGAKASSYRLTVTDMGTKTSVEVMGTRLGYTTLKASSKSSSTVGSLPWTAAPTPKITGTAKIGSKLTATLGVWSPAATVTKYAWLRDDVVIAQATSKTYVLVAADVGKKIKVRATASRAGHLSSERFSAATAKVTAQRFSTAPVPTLSGSALVGSTLKVNSGTWKPTGASLRIQWYRGTTKITGATKTSYVPVQKDIGQRLKASVTASKTGYLPVTKTSAASSATIAYAFGTTKAPVIKGSTVVGSKLTASATGWSPAPTTWSYAWKRNGVAIGGATKSTYVLATADAGAKISLTITGHKASYRSEARTSVSTANIALRQLTAVVPAIQGAAKEGEILSVAVGKWQPTGVALAIQWKRNGSAVPGATGVSYQLGSGDVGARLSVEVRGTRSGYSTKVVGSADTAVVAPLWSDRLQRNQTLWQGQKLLSGNHRYELVQQGDGNLVIYNRESGRAIWAVNRFGQGNFLAFQGDGNLVEYAPGSKVLWSPNIWGKGGVTTVMQSDGNLVVYTADGRGIWSSNTAGR